MSQGFRVRRRYHDHVEKILCRVTPGHGGCWIWTGKQQTKNGYGLVDMQSNGVRRRDLVHRQAYKLLVGPIPDGLTIDHTCHNNSGCEGGDSCYHRRCVNPAHLEAATSVDNAQRSHLANSKKTACPQGHPYTPDNTVINSVTGSRMCRACRYAWEVARRRRAGSKKRSKTHCIRGHEFTPDNLYWQRGGGRICRTCALARSKKRRMAQR